MKRALITLLVVIILLPLCIGGFLAYQWYQTDEDDMPQVGLYVQGVGIAPNGYEWHQPVFWGMSEKLLTSSQSLEAANIGTIYGSQVDISFPEGFDTVITVTRNGDIVWVGTGTEWAGHQFTLNGTYIAEVTAEKSDPDNTTGYGWFSYRFAFDIEMQPTLTTSAERVAQGDVFTVMLENIGQDSPLSISSDIIQPVFVPGSEGVYIAYIPVTHNQEPGDYYVSVSAGEYEWQVHFRVTETEFESQQLTIDTTDPVISEANSAAAYAQYREVMYPIFAEVSETRYWSGLFWQPVADAEITTTYASRRYTNGATTATPHAGIDYSVPEGTPVQAPNAGKVVLAEYLLNTGYTLVLDHGGGLKSYFFHMNALYVAEGDIVKQGDIVGEVGSTGYSTGPHLHYEVRIQDRSINPALLYYAESGLMLAEALPEEPANTVELEE